MTDQLAHAQPRATATSGADPDGVGVEVVGGGGGMVNAGDGPGTDVDVLVIRLDPGLPMPSYAHPGDAGADLRTAVDAVVEPAQIDGDRAGIDAERAGHVGAIRRRFR